ncbi:synaptonemal complex protein 3-like, partial [Trichechus manatus latirostris]|uniref:Synaptonemal complex protein 3-like n=1 Tax=Trichechus manatus latirostris TaxID=127582 RepID=A0A2Y9EDJ3_TRIMA
MASNGKNGVGKPGRSTTKDSDMGANDKEEKKDLSGSEQVEKEGKTPVTDDNGGKTPSAEPVEEEVGDELQDVLKPLGGDITEVLLAKRRRLEMNTSAAIDISKEKIENVWKTQKEQREDLTMKCSQQFLTLFQQWDIDVQKAKEQEEHLTVSIRLGFI